MSMVEVPVGVFWAWEICYRRSASRSIQHSASRLGSDLLTSSSTDNIDSKRLGQLALEPQSTQFLLTSRTLTRPVSYPPTGYEGFDEHLYSDSVSPLPKVPCMRAWFGL